MSSWVAGLEELSLTPLGYEVLRFGVPVLYPGLELRTMCSLGSPAGAGSEGGPWKDIDAES